MAHFKKKRGNATPEVSTASLPDIIFMLLFFFMVVTVMREGERKVQVVVPQATQLEKLEKKSLVNTIYIGRPTKKYQSIYGTQPRVQLDDKFSNHLDGDIALFLEQHKLKVNEQLWGQIITSIRADRDVTMGIVQDVKTALRKANQLKINYSATPDAEKMNAMN
ncbi:biopolymer transporter ExbD [Membranicola marinus]|uniref:Biopolymer transporter ExbD n=1 Tax=Membranihabitans marinus TaxID=1227546 RepID=A0A953HX88_9BACT|nr:biopolymer transporter ExbD [Membranihabitans marinus]MBY5958291.1 biopolymer transporter ExbD [Membranihabitans marinus]